jgi:hypothetical protein
MIKYYLEDIFPSIELLEIYFKSNIKEKNINKYLGKIYLLNYYI